MGWRSLNNNSFKNSPWLSTEDVSSGGMFVISDIIPEKDEIVDVEFSLPRTEDIIRCDAKVTWIQTERYEPRYMPPGFGLQFINLREESIHLISQYIDNFTVHNGWHTTPWV